MKAREREQRDLEDTVDLLRKELNRMEQARKDATIKVPSCLLSQHRYGAGFYLLCSAVW